MLYRSWVDRHVLDRRTMLARPGYALGSADRQQQPELLLEELVVVVEVVPEERERLDERAAPGHDLRAAVRDQVDLGELLEHAHRIVRAEDGDGARQPD